MSRVNMYIMLYLVGSYASQALFYDWDRVSTHLFIIVNNCLPTAPTYSLDADPIHQV